MSSVVVVDCTEISPSDEHLTDLDEIMPGRTSNTVNIIHLWRKHGINISYPRRQAPYKLPVGLVPYWADVEVVESVSGTTGLGE